MHGRREGATTWTSRYEDVMVAPRPGLEDQGGRVGNGHSAEVAPQPLPPLVDGQQPRTPWGALIVTVLLEATIPSLLSCWGILLVCWIDSEEPTMAALRNSGMLWTPVLFTATWSVTDPWSDTLSSVHGHPRACALVGSLLLCAGLLLAALGAVIAPLRQSPLLPLLSGVSAGIAAGVGASLVCTAGRLVVRQRWGGSGSGLIRSAQRFARSVGAALAPFPTLSSCWRWGPAGALLVTAALAMHSLLAPAVLRLPEPIPARNFRKYDRLKDKPRGQRVSRSNSMEDEAQTESSDDGGSVNDMPQSSSQRAPGRSQDDAGRGVTVRAQVHYDLTGERQIQGSGSPRDVVVVAPSLAPEAIARLPAEPTPPIQTPLSDSDVAPRPLYPEQGQTCNIAYSFDCDGDDDVDVFVKRLPPKRGRAARFGQGLCLMFRGCRADLRPLLRPTFHMSLYTVLCCRLAVLVLAVLLPSLAVSKIGESARRNLMAAVSGVSGVGGMLFGLSVYWESSGESGPGRFRRRMLGVVSGIAALGFCALSWGGSQWWLMFGALAAGYGSTGACWAQRSAVRDAMGGASALRAQPLLSVLAGVVTLLAVVLCDVQLSTCMAILAAMFTALSLLWLVHPHLSQYCW